MKKDINKTNVIFLYNDANDDLFAYFPDEIDHGNMHVSYSHVGQHSSASPEYAKDSRQATEGEYKDLKSELESLGYNINVVDKKDHRHSVKGTHLEKGGKVGFEVKELAGMLGTRVENIQPYVDNHNLSDRDVLKIVTGLGRKQLNSGDVATAIFLGHPDNELSKQLLEYVKSDKAYTMEKGGVVGKNAIYSKDFKSWFKFNNGTLQFKTNYAGRGARDLSFYDDVAWENVNKKNAPLMDEEHIKIIKNRLKEMIAGVESEEKELNKYTSIPEYSGRKDDLGNPTDTAQMDRWINDNMSKVDDDKYFSLGMKAKHLRGLYYEQNKLGSYAFSHDFSNMAVGGQVAFTNSNLYIKGKGIDTNGNYVIKVGFPNDRAFAIQTNGVMNVTQNILKKYDKISDIPNDELRIISNEVNDYVKNYGSPNQKSRLKIYKDHMEKGGKVDGFKKGDLVFTKEVGSRGLVGLVVSNEKEEDGEKGNDVYFRGLRGDTIFISKNEMQDILSGDHMSFAENNGDLMHYPNIAKKLEITLNPKYQYNDDPEEFSKGGEVKMLYPKSHYQDLPKYNGYNWVGFWDGKHHFTKKEKEGWAEIKASEEDLTNGNIEFMTEHGLSNENRKSVGGILLAGLIGAAIGGAAGYGYRDSITKHKEDALAATARRQKAAKDKIEQQKAAFREKKERVKRSIIGGIERLESGGNVAYDEGGLIGKKITFSRMVDTGEKGFLGNKKEKQETTGTIWDRAKKFGSTVYVVEEDGTGELYTLALNEFGKAESTGTWPITIEEVAEKYDGEIENATRIEDTDKEENKIEDGESKEETTSMETGGGVGTKTIRDILEDANRPRRSTEDFEPGTPVVYHSKNYKGEQEEESGEVVTRDRMKTISLYANKNYANRDNPIVLKFNHINWNNVETFKEANERGRKKFKLTEDFVVYHSPMGGSMAVGGKVSPTKKKLLDEIKILQEAIDNSLLDDAIKNKIPAKIEAKKKKIAELDEEDRIQAGKERMKEEKEAQEKALKDQASNKEKLLKEAVDREKKLRTQSLKNKNIYIDIDKQLKEKMRNAIHEERIPYSSKTEGNVFRVFLSNQYQLDIVTKLYNERREKYKMEPVSKEDVANVIKQRIGKLKFMPVKVKPNLKEKLLVDKKRSIKKVEKKRGSLKGKLDEESEG